jgi:hypothetical protein
MRRLLVSLGTLCLSALAGLFLLFLLITPTAWTSLYAAKLSSITARQVASESDAAIIVLATVGTTRQTCAQTTSITVTAGTEIVFCFVVTNTGSITLTDHFIEDPIAGIHHPITDKPLAPLGGSLFITVAAPVAHSLHSTITWTASDTFGAQATAHAEIDVIVPAISVSHTVGVDSHTCAITSTVEVMEGSDVTHCFQVMNRDDVTFYTHHAIDSQLGVVADQWPHTLAPGERVQFTVTEVATSTHTSLVTWTAIVSDGLVAANSSLATVKVPALVATTTVGLAPNECASTREISVTIGNPVYFCYVATNQSGVDFHQFAANDTIGDDLPIVGAEPLIDNSSASLVAAAIITQPTVNTVTWQAQTLSGLTATAVSAAVVNALSQLEITTFYDVNRNLKQDPGEPYVNNVAVTLTLAPVLTTTLYTTETGFVSFTELANGHYTLTASTENLTPTYLIASTEQEQPLVIGEPAIYTLTIPLTRADDADTDGDSIPDHIEGVEDINHNGKYDFEDPENVVLLPIARRE